MMKILLTLVAVFAIAAGTLLAVAYGGFVDVSATGAHSQPVEWFLHTTRESAIHAAVEDLEVPPLDDPAKLRSGLVHYHSMCVVCHGAPGVKPGEIAQGLNPMPPELDSHDGGEERAKETFWVVKHGIRMTGMPAFGPTHSDEALWAITALVQRLPDLSAEEYTTMVANAGLEPAGGGHSHGDGGHGGGDGAGPQDGSTPEDGASEDAHDHGTHDHG